MAIGEVDVAAVRVERQSHLVSIIVDRMYSTGLHANQISGSRVEFLLDFQLSIAGNFAVVDAPIPNISFITIDADNDGPCAMIVRRRSPVG